MSADYFERRQGVSPEIPMYVSQFSKLVLFSPVPFRGWGTTKKAIVISYVAAVFAVSDIIQYLTILLLYRTKKTHKM